MHTRDSGSWRKHVEALLSRRRPEEGRQVNGRGEETMAGDAVPKPEGSNGRGDKGQGSRPVPTEKPAEIRLERRFDRSQAGGRSAPAPYGRRAGQSRSHRASPGPRLRCEPL